MLARFVLLVPALLGLALSSATDAEARRFKLFVGSTKTWAKREPVGAAPAGPTSPAAAPGAAAPPVNRSGALVFAGGPRPAAAPAEGPAPSPDETRPVPAASAHGPTLKPAPARESPLRPADRFETVSSQTSGFEVVKLRN